MLWYKLVFRQNKPIHIGSLNWGVINQTFIFIPGWRMWGALTKAYNLNRIQPLSSNQELFATITCFYASFDESGNNPLFPEHKDGVFHLRDYPEDKFRQEFTDTFVSTAILPESRSAKEESLHEIEVLLPKSRIEEDKQIYWTGLLGINHDEILNNSLDKGLKIWVGGDLRYGLGELELTSKKELSNSELEEWQLDDGAMLNLSSKNELKNFLEFSSDLNFQGELILHAEFDFSKNEPRVKEAKYLITPGSKILNGLISNNYKLTRGKFIKLGG